MIASSNRDVKPVLAKGQGERYVSDLLNKLSLKTSLLDMT